jgi:serine/threonine-protein kinase
MIDGMSEGDGAARRVGMTLLGKYRIDRVLGVGGMAVVYAATHRNAMRFAVKMLHPELSMSHDIRTRFMREGYAANSVDHPGTVKVIDDDVAEDGSAFIVMELLQGAGVEQVWQGCGRRVPVQASVVIVDQTLDVLSAAHRKGIVHRDIKPANLFLVREHMIKVLDFGIARVRDAAANASGSGTGTGMLLGTPAFMPPEQAYAQSSAIDAQTDVWAAAATLFTLLSGRFVHEGENASQLLVKAATQAARPLLSVAPGIPGPIAQVVDRGLAFGKEGRWPSAAAMRDALREAYLGVFGTRPSRDVLADLHVGEEVPEPLAAPDATAQAARNAPPNATAAAPSGVAWPVWGGTTAKPVSAGTAPSPSLPEARGWRRGLVPAAAVVTVVAAVALAVRLHGAIAPVGGGLGAPPLATATANLALSAPPAPTVTPPPPSYPPRDPEPAALAAAPAPEPTASHQTREPSSTGKGRLPAPARDAAGYGSAPPSAATVSPPPSAQQVPASSPPTASVPRCRVVKDFDNEGNIHFKEVCD